MSLTLLGVDPQRLYKSGHHYMRKVCGVLTPLNCRDRRFLGVNWHDKLILSTRQRTISQTKLVHKYLVALLKLNILSGWFYVN